MQIDIRLYLNNEAGLILKMKTGVFYALRCGGGAYHPRVEEGVYIPLPIDTLVLREYFAEGKWESNCDSGIDDETLEFLNDYLADPPLDYYDLTYEFIRVNSKKMKESVEAWVEVIVRPQNSDLVNLLESDQDKPFEAVLVWENSV